HGGAARTCIEPMDARITTEPRHLAAGELPGPFHGALRSLIEREPTVEVTRQLRVADRLGRRQPRAEAAVHQRADLVEPTALQHREHALGDPALLGLPIDPDARGTDAIGGVSVPCRSERAERRAADRRDLEGTDGPADVAGLDARGGYWVRLGQPPVQRLRPEVVRLGLEG